MRAVPDMAMAGFFLADGFVGEGLIGREAKGLRLEGMRRVREVGGRCQAWRRVGCRGWWVWAGLVLVGIFVSLAGEAVGRAGWRTGVGAAVRDEDVRDNLEDAYRELIKAYGRISGRRGPTGAVLEDRRTRRHLKRAAHSMREAATTVRGAKQRTRRRRGAGVIIVVVAAGGAAAVAMNDDLRERLRAMVGAGEPSGPPQGSNGSGPTSVQPEGAPPSAATSTP